MSEKAVKLTVAVDLDAEEERQVRVLADGQPLLWTSAATGMSLADELWEKIDREQRKRAFVKEAQGT